MVLVHLDTGLEAAGLEMHKWSESHELQLDTAQNKDIRRFDLEEISAACNDLWRLPHVLNVKQIETHEAS